MPASIPAVAGPRSIRRWPGKSGSANGLAGGGQSGCDRQGGRWLIGIQAMADFASVDGSHAAIEGTNLHDDIKALATLTGRAGYLFSPEVLGYIKAGGAWARVNSSNLSAGGFLIESAQL
ncbi:outer membrane protein [Mesorhizobium captivum]|uniref:outer membrane protein n=1 Tax=Mesorhizobium captivum TaxID=3072319 RepID=UPI002A2439DF|nr:hypothetical protein [Mesorhizobium sp. VK23E]MDX8515561.1 hypothetical protein [Mesorhizobium sp. VK23E]